MNTRRIAAAIFVVSAVVASGTGSAAPFSSQNSPQTRARVVVRRTDVIYGRVQGAALLADLAFPEGDDVKPAILYVFGGRWRSGSRVNNQGNWERLANLAESGFFTMTIDHRLVGGSPAPAPYEDTLCAIRWLHAHAGEYGVDQNRIFLIGNSSGGHLVALAATLGDGPFARAGGWEKSRSDFRAAISVAAPYDLNTLSWGNLWTPVSGDVEAARRQASPNFQIGPNSRPLLVIHSDDDQSVPITQALDMVDALKAAKVLHKFVRYANRGHVGLTDEVLHEAQVFIDEIEKTPH